LTKGLNINLVYGVDFTGSNGDPTNSNSLHYYNPNSNTLNQYQTSLFNISNILISYDSDKSIPM